MNHKLKADVVQRDDVTYVKLAGVIDEDNDLGTLIDRIGPGTCAIDLGGIERINSCGVRDWVNWLGKVEKAGAKSVLLECSPAIVAQINLVNNFTGGGVVKSFYAPYFCPACELEKVLLIETQEMIEQDPPKAPTCRCDECDGVMDFDDMDSYFAFVSTMKNRALFHPKVDAVVAEVSPSDGERKIRSRIGSAGSTSNSSTTGVGSQSGSLPRAGGGGVGLAAAASNPTTGVRSFGPSRTGNSGVGFSSPGSAPGPQIGVANPIGIPMGGGQPQGGSSKTYGVAIVVLILVAAGLLFYALFYAGPKEKKSASTLQAPAATLAARGRFSQSSLPDATL